MKQIIALLFALFMGVTLSAQTIKQQEATFDDYLPLLQQSGYQAYSFDITEFLNDTYMMSIKVKEYTDSTDVKVLDERVMVPNRVMMSELSESFQKKVLAEGIAVDAEKGIFTQSEKIIIGFYPSKSDSLKTAYLSLEGQGARTMFLTLKGLKLSDNDKPVYAYFPRPFKVDKFEEGKFIPLVLLGSGWIDRKWGVFRFCGEPVIDPDMSTSILKDIPHYYVIGVEVKKK